MEAVVKWFNNEKGYGFIKYKNYEDIFVHYSALQLEEFKFLSEGDIVEFNLVYTSKGYQAKDVTLKTNSNLKKFMSNEKVHLAASIVTIVSFILSFVDNDEQVNNTINVNCDNCKIQIIDKNSSDNKVTQYIDKND